MAEKPTAAPFQVKRKEKRKTESPIKQKPLPQAGDSLRERHQEIVLDWMGYLLLPSIMTIYALLEWLNQLFHVNRSPWITTVLVAVAWPFFLWKSKSLTKERDRVRLGLQGEIVVSQVLDSYVREGYAVFHDVPTGHGNIDHVLVGPNGVFVVETKTRSKLVGTRNRVVYDGEHVLVNGRAPDRNPVMQAKACAAFLRKLIRDHTALDIAVRAVVLFPDWSVKPHSGSEVWVLNQNMLEGWIRHERKSIPARDIELITLTIRNHVSVRNGKSC